MYFVLRLPTGREPGYVAPGSVAPGRAVQVDPMKPALKPPGTKRLKLTYDKLLSNVAFKINLRRYSLAGSPLTRMSSPGTARMTMTTRTIRKPSSEGK